ncbi:MAG: Crp/Fnr family transcriptional regulator [Candidatus Melainabacteria bacterium]
METSNTGPKMTVDVIEFTKGQLVIREGDEGDCAFILLSGQVEVYKSFCEGTRNAVIATLGPNEIIGEMCLFSEDGTRSANVRVISDFAKVMAISKSNFRKQVDQLPDGVRSIINVLITRLRQADNRILFLS